MWDLRNKKASRRRLVSVGAPTATPARPIQQGSIAEHFLLQLSALLGFKRQGGGGASQQTTDPDGFTGFIAVAVVTRVNVLDGLLNLL